MSTSMRHVSSSSITYTFNEFSKKMLNENNDFSSCGSILHSSINQILVVPMFKGYSIFLQIIVPRLSSRCTMVWYQTLLNLGPGKFITETCQKNALIHLFFVNSVLQSPTTVWTPKKQWLLMILESQKMFKIKWITKKIKKTLLILLY